MNLASEFEDLPKRITIYLCDSNRPCNIENARNDRVRCHQCARYMHHAVFPDVVLLSSDSGYR